MTDALTDVLSDGGALIRPSPTRDIAIVGAPIVLLGGAGTVVGLSTLVGGALVNLGYVLAIALGAYLLWHQRSGWREIGLGAPSSWLRTALLGLGAGLGAILVVVLVQAVVPALLVAAGVDIGGPDVSRFNPIEGNVPLFALMLVLSWTTIAFGEELFYRAFVISRLVDHADTGAWVAILFGGALFGVVHFAEGPVGILSNGAFGVLFGWIYVRSGRNLWITIVGHGLINTLRFALVFAGAV